MTISMTTIEFKTGQLMTDIRRILPDVSLRDIAAETGGRVSAATLSRLDKGNVPDMHTFMALCAEFDLTPSNYFQVVKWERSDTSATHGKSATVDAGMKRVK